ncbi:MAG: hypothetical protein LUD51_00500 [Clostridia bacterium]|nr:hypothetical protein [Clostridia bacterium]
MKKGSKVRRICLCVCACAAAIALVAVAACAEDMTVHEFGADDATTFNSGMTNITAYSGDYTVGLTKTEGDTSDGYVFSYEASSGRLITQTLKNGDIVSGLYFDGNADSVYTSASASASSTMLMTPEGEDGSTITYSEFTSLKWLPYLLVQKGSVDTVSDQEDITDFVTTVISGVKTLVDVDASAISSDSLVVESNQYCEEFVLSGGALEYTMQFATSQASNIGDVTYPLFTYLSIDIAGYTTIECYISFNYKPAAWNGPASASD